MIEKLVKPYKGLSTEVWYLALTTLINRTGAMVLPFLSVYLKNFLSFSLEDIGWVMSCYGLGSVFGVFLGGKLSDRIGYYKVLYASLIATGLVFIGLQWVREFPFFCLGIFVLTTVADAFRPAIWVALDDYSTEENRTRSVTLIRLAINLGFSLGPALGGIIITYISYSGIFWVDGLTCLIAAGVILLKLTQKSPVKTKEERKNESVRPPYFDKKYLGFWIAMFLVGFTFMQYFSTVPLYYNEVLDLNEDSIGLMLALNGFLIFLTEMPLVHNLEKGKLEDLKIVIVGTVSLLLSFLALNVSLWIGMALISILLMTLGEMLGFPFSNSFALDRSKKGNQGAYMAMYSMSFSVAHILGPNVGLQFSAAYGFSATWYLMAGVCGLAVLLLFLVRRMP